jgi:hypothetical protein
MNSLGSIHGGATCEPKLPWEWRCRLLEPDDVAGVAAVYGGTPHPVRTPATCPLYRAISRPAKVVVSRDAATGAVTLAFVRPADSTVPVFVAPPQWRHHAGFALVSGSATCPGPDAITTAPRFRWNVPVSGTQDLEVPDSATSVCYAIWAIDSLGRPSDKPSTITVPGRG